MGGAAVTIILRGAVPQTPTNAERLREYRNRAEPVIGNLRAWDWCAAAREMFEAEQYARQETLDGAYPTTDTYGD